MAGSFGYGKDTYEISMKMANERLFPTIKKNCNEVIVKADGTATVGKGDNYIEFPQALSSPLRGTIDPNLYALYMVKNMSPA